MAQLGRISGGILRDNLERQGVNLNFTNVQSDVTGGTPLLHLDVNNTRIGINTNALGSDLEVASTLGTVALEVEINLETPGYSIENSEIRANSGDILLTATDRIFATSIATDDLNFDNDVISSYTTDTNIELRPDSGVLTIGSLANKTDWNINGNLYSTGDITFGGDLTLGDSDLDNVNFKSDLNSDLTPTDNNAYGLGTSAKKWLNLYSNSVDIQQITTGQLLGINFNPALRQGNILYVSTNGSNSNPGNHQNAPFRTIKHALSVSNNNTPLAIQIYPGEYEEDFPLILSTNVSIIGTDLRNTIIKPSAATQSNDAFMLQQGSTVENVTIKDFFYNSVNNTGHAFRFVSGGVITSRSPYIQNVTVITSGSATSASDPRGFNSRDAGRGAYIDGSELNPTTTEATMLFSSATFITPGVDAITLTNGVRVEWLNCFTYFAEKGLHAIEGATGRSNSGDIRFGGELRSIGSANIYGNIGAVADGPNCLMYLISHNFAYIGTQGDVSNDNTLVIQQNEVIEIDFGKIYYNSTDALGTYRVGDQFFVDLETGITSINSDTVDLSGVGAININTGGAETFINGERIDTGNIRISGNTISNIADDLIISPFSGSLTLNNLDLVISRGTDAERTFVPGNIRFNIDTSLYEGFSSANLGFSGVYSDDRQTSLTATDTSNELKFKIDQLEVAKLTGSQLVVPGLATGLLLFDANMLTSTSLNTDINLVRDGTGVVSVFDFNLTDAAIINTSNSPLVLTTTDRGYVKFNSTTALQIPSGTDAQRPVMPETGVVRWNTELQTLEIWDSAEWVSAVSTAGTSVTEEDFLDLLDIYTLVLG